MGGFDEYILMQELIKKGWKEVYPGKGSYFLKPPSSLFENAPKIFHVSDAEQIQLYLEPEESDLKN